MPAVSRRPPVIAIRRSSGSDSTMRKIAGSAARADPRLACRRTGPPAGWTSHSPTGEASVRDLASGGAGTVTVAVRRRSRDEPPTLISKSPPSGTHWPWAGLKNYWSLALRSKPARAFRCLARRARPPRRRT